MGADGSFIKIEAPPPSRLGCRKLEVGVGLVFALIVRSSRGRLTLTLPLKAECRMTGLALDPPLSPIVSGARGATLARPRWIISPPHCLAPSLM